jgi:hypothetical protein
MSIPKLQTIPTNSPGRPRKARLTAMKVVGVAGVQALEAAGLSVIPSALLRDIALLLHDPTAIQPTPQPNPDPPKSA